MNIGSYYFIYQPSAGKLLLDWIAQSGVLFSWLDCDWKSKVKNWILIWIVNPVFPFPSNPKKFKSFFIKLYINLRSIMLQLKKQAILIQKRVWLFPWEFCTCFTYEKKLSKFIVIEFFLKLLDFDWIDNPKNLYWATACNPVITNKIGRPELFVITK